MYVYSGEIWRGYDILMTSGSAKNSGCFLTNIWTDHRNKVCWQKQNEVAIYVVYEFSQGSWSLWFVLKQATLATKGHSFKRPVIIHVFY